VQSGISRLLALFPDRDFDTLVIDEYNRIGNNEFERIRDFLVLHYKLTARDDGELWRHCSAMSIPDSLQYKIEHFKRFGRVVVDSYDLFGPPSWVAVHLGQLNMPQRHDPLLHHRSMDGNSVLKQLRNAMLQAADAMPSHMDYIRRNCASD
jgi:tryptophan halogenase